MRGAFLVAFDFFSLFSFVFFFERPRWATWVFLPGRLKLLSAYLMCLFIGSHAVLFVWGWVWGQRVPQTLPWAPPGAGIRGSWWGWLPGVLQIQQGEEISISVTAITMSGQLCFSWCWLGVWHQNAQILACVAGRAQVCSAQRLRCLLLLLRKEKGDERGCCDRARARRWELVGFVVSKCFAKPVYRMLICSLIVLPSPTKQGIKISCLFIKPMWPQ